MGESMIPGEVVVKNKNIILNAGLASISIVVKNDGDRPIQIGSHFHFFESNRFLKFDRASTYGYRLNIPSGTAVRFEPGETKTIHLVPFTGKKSIFGLNNLTDAQVNESTLAQSLRKAELKGFLKKGQSNDYQD
jgi:urease beta subunit